MLEHVTVAERERSCGDREDLSRLTELEKMAELL